MKMFQAWMENVRLVSSYQRQHFLPLLRQLPAAAPAEEVEPSGLEQAQFPVLESFIKAVASIVF